MDSNRSPPERSRRSISFKDRKDPRRQRTTPKTSFPAKTTIFDNRKRSGKSTENQEGKNDHKKNRVDGDDPYSTDSDETVIYSSDLDINENSEEKIPETSNGFGFGWLTEELKPKTVAEGDGESTAGNSSI
ncbi:MAG: hypothetical protein MHMPM18_001550 [Marteilia pararefringens]